MAVQSDNTSQNDFSWAIPVMRTGYMGRAAVYLIVASLSLWGVVQGSGTTGTSDALAKLEGSTAGVALLALIGIGMLCYGVWRLLAAAFDLEEHGADGKGVLARLGMAVTGLLHLGLAGLVGTLLFNIGTSEGGQSMIVKAAGDVMALPFGRMLVGAVGLVVLGAGVYYLVKGWRRSYEKHLRANQWTTRLSPALRGGLFAQGIIVGGVGALLCLAAAQGDPQEAGGLTKVMSWLYGTPMGWVLVGAICIGLFGFALFCAVNAIWRVVPRADGPDIQTLKRKARENLPGQP